MFATSTLPMIVSLGMLALGGAAATVAAARYFRETRQLLNFGDALSHLAIVTLSERPARFDERLLDALTRRFAMLDARYATRENAATILAVLEECGALVRDEGILSLTHRGFQMRLRLASGEPARGLASEFKRKRHAFSLTKSTAA